MVKRTATSKLSSELYHVKNEISDWFYQYDTEKYRIYVNHEYESEVLALSRPDTEPLEIVTLRFDEGEKRFDGDDISDSLTYTLIQNVRFNCDEDIPDLVKCTVVYMADGKTGEYVFALVKKSG